MFINSIISAFVTNVSFNSDTNTYTLTGNFEITDNNSNMFPITIEDGKVFDGNNYTITYNGTGDWGGLFQPLSGSSDTDHTNFIIKNINFELNSNVAEKCGAIINYYFYNSDTKFEYCNITIENCHLNGSGEISTDQCGGIVGKFGRNSSCNVKYCSNTLAISGAGAGGICGPYVGPKTSNVYIEYCWNDGDITGDGAGGICGRAIGYNGENSENVLIHYCYNTGSIIGQNVGGICGSYSVYCTIFNCYNNGNNTHKDGSYHVGGILGKYGGNGGGEVNIYNCWSRCNYVKGGIASNTASDGTVNVLHCYYNGGGNITGDDVSESNVIKHTYSEGWDYTSAKSTIGTRVDGYNYDLKWYIPGFNDRWEICDSVDENGFNICNGSVLYCDDSKANNYGSKGQCGSDPDDTIINA